MPNKSLIETGFPTCAGLERVKANSRAAGLGRASRGVPPPSCSELGAAEGKAPHHTRLGYFAFVFIKLSDTENGITLAHTNESTFQSQRKILEWGMGMGGVRSWRGEWGWEG